MIFKEAVWYGSLTPGVRDFEIKEMKSGDYTPIDRLVRGVDGDDFMDVISLRSVIMMLNKFSIFKLNDEELACINHPKEFKEIDAIREASGCAFFKGVRDVHRIAGWLKAGIVVGALVGFSLFFISGLVLRNNFWIYYSLAWLLFCFASGAYVAFKIKRMLKAAENKYEYVRHQIGKKVQSIRWFDIKKESSVLKKSAGLPENEVFTPISKTSAL